MRTRTMIAMVAVFLVTGFVYRALRYRIMAYPAPTHIITYESGVWSVRDGGT